MIVPWSPKCCTNTMLEGGPAVGPVDVRVLTTSALSVKGLLTLYRTHGGVNVICTHDKYKYRLAGRGFESGVGRFSMTPRECEAIRIIHC